LTAPSSNRAGTALTALAFDYGAKKTGVATGQTTTGTAQALETIMASGDVLLDRAGALIDEWKPDALVFGLPLAADGSDDTPICRSVKQFAATLKKRHGKEVYFVDERLTSSAADNAIRDSLAPGKRMSTKQRQARDAMAAQLILESWLGSQ